MRSGSLSVWSHDHVVRPAAHPNRTRNSAIPLRLYQVIYGQKTTIGSGGQAPAAIGQIKNTDSSWWSLAPAGVRTARPQSKETSKEGAQDQLVSPIGSASPSYYYCHNYFSLMTGTTGKHTIPQTTSHTLARMHIGFRFLSRIDDLTMVRRCLNRSPVDTVIAAR